VQTTINGIKQIKKKIEINAPVEVCYQTWINQAKFPEFMRKILKFREGCAPEEATLPTALKLTGDIVDPDVVRHWLVTGPRGKLYQFENKVILEIPNRLFSTQSTDPNDLCVQVSVLFFPLWNNHATRIDWQVSFWESAKIKSGHATQLALDVFKTDDSLIEDCLTDLKHYIEALPSPNASSKGMSFRLH
jgi:uncharacterized membrane protein